MNLKKSILLWSMGFGALFLAVSFVLEQFCGLMLRIWLRESLTILIAAGIAAGVLQAVLHIPNKTAKIICGLLWIPAAAASCIFGYVLFAFSHLEETTRDYEGQLCIVETEDYYEGYDDRYYEYHGWFVRGTKLLYEE
ncbi:MAG: hypothetical protein IKQ39_02070 [Oscillospiraceae bacterium]|nr:hypothetical protein [Oscillospiraceae bacterium]